MCYYDKKVERLRLKYHREYCAFLIFFMVFLVPLNLGVGWIVFHAGNLPMGCFLWTFAGMCGVIMIYIFRVWIALGRDLKKLL